MNRLTQILILSKFYSKSLERWVKIAYNKKVAHNKDDTQDKKIEKNSLCITSGYIFSLYNNLPPQE